MFAAMLNGLKSMGTGMSGAATSGTFGAGGKPFLGGEGTALGGGAMGEFGVGATVGGAAKTGLEGLMGKVQNMTPEQKLMIASQMAQFAAPPAMGAMQRPQAPVPQYSNFMNPAAGQPTPAPQLRTPLGIGG